MLHPSFMARPPPRASRCPYCNAPFAPRPGKTHYTCGYCGEEFDLGGPGQPPDPPRPPTPAKSAQPPVVMAAALGAMVMMGLLAGLLMVGSDPEPEPEPEPAPYVPPPRVVRPQPPPPPVPPPAPPPERVQWMERDAPVFVDVNGDGTDDIVGHVRRFGGASNTDLIAAFDGKTFQKLWESLPSEGPDASSRTKVIAQNGMLVSSEQRAVNLLELATGKRLGQVPLSDSPRRLCIPPGDTHSVWVEVINHKHLLFDTRTATAKPALRSPPGCATPPLSPETCDMSRPPEHPTRCVRSSYPPSDIRGFSTRYLFRSQGYTLSMGTRWPGTQVPLVAVYEPGNRKPLWHGVVADKDPLLLRDTPPRVGEITRDAVYILYEMDNDGARLVRRDLRTGAIAWDVPLPHKTVGMGPSALWVHGGRVYLPNWMWLDVFDAATGKLEGTIGTR
ncbi:YncE family protein [Corallococcus soli]